MPSTSEAVERAAVANGGKNLIDRGPRCYERSQGELLPQTFPSEPSTAVEQQQANPLPDLPPTVPRAQSLRMLTMAGSARLHGHIGSCNGKQWALQVHCVSEDDDAAQGCSRAPPRAHRT